ncbi:HEAT repeat domain-containing protein [Kribbella soli]|uniref:HEAT repeat domain-containing protein n=1 Tax=Kribbella soli TaxID=1124743 RepID=A0A4R0HGT6_9ACTN|nr:HEAT repeat domain-containing protein [Kribbella soli]TCC08112.1 HEAT repeat domain-containing protein [Kribbella soli]
MPTPPQPALDRTSRRLILRDHVGNADVRAFVDAAGWTFVGQIDRDLEHGIGYEAKWSTDGGDAHYVVDEFADVVYLLAPDAAHASIENALSVWTLDELIEDSYVHVYPAGWAKSVLRLGAGAPVVADERVLDHLVFSAQHADVPVRRAALWAMVYAAWPEFTEALTALARDEDPGIAREALDALELLSAAQAGGR